MKHKLLITICLLVLGCVGLVRAGSVTQTNHTWRSINETEIQWVITTNQFVSGTVAGLDGQLERIVIVAGALSTVTNTITLTDVDGIDVLLGQGAESGTTINVYADNGDTTLPITVSGYHPYTFAVTNSTLGVSVTTNGTVRLYWR